MLMVFLLRAEHWLLVQEREVVIFRWARMVEGVFSGQLFGATTLAD